MIHLCEFPVFGGCVVVLEENVFVFIRRTRTSDYQFTLNWFKGENVISTVLVTFL